MDYKKIKRLRRIYIIISIIIGVTAPLLCYFLLPTFNIKSEPLSKFGISTQTSKIWFWSLIVISLGLWLNGEYRIKELIKRTLETCIENNIKGISIMFSPNCGNRYVLPLDTQNCGSNFLLWLQPFCVYVWDCKVFKLLKKGNVLCRDGNFNVTYFITGYTFP